MQREYGTDHTGNGSERAAGTGIGFRATYQKRFEATTHVFNNGGGRHPMRIMRVGLPMEDAYPSHSEARQEEPAVITLQPEKRAPIHLTQKLLMQQYLSTWISEEHVRTGEQRARHYPKWAMTATKSHKYGDAVALDFGHWDKQAMGVEEVPFVILLPHHNGTVEYGLVGLVATNTPNHVVAYIPSARRKDTEWVTIDGMVQKCSGSP
ncbi:putative SLACS retrotransposable element [Trypanosoma cruzi]|uniref:Putative SLACS retrotransposable element n=1 Tax=Trypanosoma cruzi TaxID=5693 RepID=A0A2V2WN80_TRYCR|nr:putative SLACS retrotransposable element [Trypanosoma cruzi]